MFHKLMLEIRDINGLMATMFQEDNLVDGDDDVISQAIKGTTTASPEPPIEAGAIPTLSERRKQEIMVKVLPHLL
jgi:hypothetical protein